MASMSASDLLLGIIVCLPSQVSALVQFWPFTNALCQVTGIVNGMSISVSMWSLTAISVERYLVIVQPLHFNQQPRLHHVQLGIAFIWVFNTFYYVIPVCIHPQMSYYIYQADMLVCGFVWEPDWMLYLAGALYPIGPGLIIVFCSYQIIQVIRQSNSRIISMVSGNTNARPVAPVAAKDSSDNVKDDSESDGNSTLNTSAPDADVKAGKTTSVAKKKKSKPQHVHSNLRKATIRREAKVCKVMIITAAAFFSCSFPYLCSAVVEKNGVSITNWHSFCVMWLLNCNSFINVFIYSTTYPEFRYLFKVTFLPFCYPEQSTAKARNVSSHR